MPNIFEMYMKLQDNKKSIEYLQSKGLIHSTRFFYFNYFFSGNVLMAIKRKLILEKKNPVGDAEKDLAGSL